MCTLNKKEGNRVYYHHSISFLILLFLVLAIVVGLIFIGVVGVAFSDVGFSPLLVALILVATLLGSFINIPIAKLKSSVPIVREKYVSFFGLTYRIPQVHYSVAVTTLAINAGGALIPTAVSVYLLTRVPASTIVYSMVGVIAVASITHLLAKPVRGVGIVTPVFIPPFTAALVAIMLTPSAPSIVAYVSGVLGTLIGADLLNLHRISSLGAPLASIGGAGTFDGVFLSGILAVILTAL